RLAVAYSTSADGRVGLGIVGGEAAEALDYLGDALDEAGVPRDAVSAFELDERRNKKDQNWPDQGEKLGLRSRLAAQGITHFIEVPEDSELGDDTSLLAFAREYNNRLERDIPRDQQGQPLYVALMG